MATLLDIVKKGSTDRSVVVRVIDSTTGAPETGVAYNTSGIDLWYRREGAAKTSITEATLSALTDAHSDGGFLHIGDGEYRVDLPDAAFATGANYVDVGGTVTGMIVIGGRVRLTNFDIEIETQPVNLTQILGTALTETAGQIAAAFKKFFDIASPTSTMNRLTLVDTTTANTDMRGTDSAATAAELAKVPKSDGAVTWNETAVAQVQSGLATSVEVTAIQNNTRVVRVVPTVIERPDTGTVTYRIELLLYDATGNMEAPDSAPTIALVDQGGTDLSARLDSATMALVSTGRYRAIYTATSTDDLEQLVWTFSVVEGGATRLYGNTSLIVDTSAVDFTAADRNKLEALNSDWTDGGRLDLLIDAIVARMGAITGSGDNTLLGFFKAALNKAAATPSDIGGTFDPAADSTEALRDRGDAEWTTATGFSTLDAAGVRTAVGMATANLDTQLSTISTAAVLARKLKTGNIRDKSGSPGVYEILDDDDATVIATLTLAETTPYQQVTLS